MVNYVVDSQLFVLQDTPKVLFLVFSTSLFS